MNDLDTARQNLAQAIARLREAEQAMADSLAWVDITFGLIRARCYETAHLTRWAVVRLAG